MLHHIVSPSATLGPRSTGVGPRWCHCGVLVIAASSPFAHASPMWRPCVLAGVASLWGPLIDLFLEADAWDPHVSSSYLLGLMH
ncbi:hypothetical protein E2562_034139 [Oryza meyeriana var. granulata]|uniref:Uncharacterized protein n=1 Tax=Oryza meyeriana var. granulata TaxID=110450 RepID=A0A6G1CV64_9ORYZ|nr:hypothetical protein E2562_034139 [Oryza meyeriana var. granulata]